VESVRVVLWVSNGRIWRCSRKSRALEYPRFVLKKRKKQSCLLEYILRKREMTLEDCITFDLEEQMDHLFIMKEAVSLYQAFENMHDGRRYPLPFILILIL
jgi:hypothetical protein